MAEADLPDGRICHLTNERVRVRIPQRQRDHGFFTKVQQQLSSWQSVERVDVNPVTASVLIHFKDASKLFNDYQEHDKLFRLVVADLAATGLGFNGEPIVETARRGFAAIDRGLREGSGGRTDLRALAFVGLVGAGLAQLFNGRITAPAVTLFWYAGDLLGIWRPSDRQALSERNAVDDDNPPSGNGSAAD